MDVQAELRRPGHEAALRAVQKPPAKPWRGGSGPGSGSAPPPPPPKVYRVEPRQFRDLVQKLTGAPPPRGGGLLARPQQQQQHQTMPAAVVQPQQPVPVRAGGGNEQQMLASQWFSFPLGGIDSGNGGIM